MTELGQRVRAMRRAQNLTQENLARKASMPLGRVTLIERGITHDPHLSTLRGIAGAFGITIGELLREEGSRD